MKSLLFPFFFFSVFCFSQNYEWAKSLPVTYSLNPDYLKYAVATDNLGNVYTTGFKDTQYFYTELYGNVFYNKYDSNGNLIFSKIFTGKIYVNSIKTDILGNVYISISVIDSVTIDTTTITASNEYILLKFDSNGNLLWNKKINSYTAGNYNLNDITFDSSNNIYIAIENYTNSHILKLNSVDGTLLSTISQNNVKILSSISVDTNGNIFCAGSCAQTNATFGGTSFPSPDFYNDYIVKYNSSGVFQWGKYTDAITCHSNHKVIAYSPNEIYLSSNLYGTSNFDTFSVTGSASGDFYLAKLNANGNFLWVKDVPASQTGYLSLGNRNYLSVDNFGNPFIVGKTQNTIHWNGSVTTTGFGGYAGDLIITKFNPNGDVTYAKVAGSTSYDRMDAISIYNNSIYLAGVASNSSNFDGISTSSANSSPVYPVLAKITFNSMNVDDLSINHTIIINNPVKEFVIFSNNKYDNALAEIYNIEGKLILKGKIENSKLQISQLSNGTYILKTKHETYKIIKY